MRKQLLFILLQLFCLQCFADTTALDSLFAKGEQCYLMDDYRGLSLCIEEYEEILEDFIGQEDADLASEYYAYAEKMNGAYCYGMSGRDDNTFNESLRHYNASYSILRDLHKDYQANVVMQELAQLYYKHHKYTLAKECLERAASFLKNRIFMGIDDDEAEYMKVISNLAMCNARIGDYSIALQRIDSCVQWQQRNAPKEVNESLRRKGKILILSGRKPADKEIQHCYEQYVRYSLQTTPKQLLDMTESEREQYWLASQRFLYDCVRLGNASPEMIYDLSLFTKGYLQTFKQRSNGSQVKWTDVRRALRFDECAVEFLQYQGYDDENRLAALVLRNNSKKPVFVDILNIDSLMEVDLNELSDLYYEFGDYNNWFWSYTPPLTVKDFLETTDASQKNVLYESNVLQTAIWCPNLMSLIGNASRVLFSPDGFLHQYALEYCIPDTTKTAFRLSSTRVIAERRHSSATSSLNDKSKALLFGGIDYDAKPNPKSRGNDRDAYKFLAHQWFSIKYLYGSKNEVDSIYNIRHNPNDMLYSGTDATDENLRQQVGQQFSIVHLSTHGYFCGTIGMGTDIKPVLKDNSMSESGLLFSGASSTLKDWDFDENLSDGVLSARELSQLNLHDVKLMVLSACQTGMGYVTSDGVYGLSRAMKLAGVEGMIVSLWSVNDYSTCFLMKYFYEILHQQQNKDIHKAFMEARRRLMTQEVELTEFSAASLHMTNLSYIFDKPQYVNPFILIDIF